MPKSIDYTVTLYPAQIERGYVTTSVDIFGGTYPKRNISAAGMDNLTKQISDFAKEYGKGCSASAKCLAPRKPSGFKSATANLYFNLEQKPAEAANA